jgi:hypothetical protein
MSGHFIAFDHAREATRSQFEPAPQQRTRRPRAVFRPAAATTLRALADRLEPRREPVPRVRRA